MNFSIGKFLEVLHKVCLLHFRHRNLFHHLSRLGAVNQSEKVNEVVPALCLSYIGLAWYNAPSTIVRLHNNPWCDRNMLCNRIGISHKIRPVILQRILSWVGLWACTFILSFGYRQWHVYTSEHTTHTYSLNEHTHTHSQRTHTRGPAWTHTRTSLNTHTDLWTQTHTHTFSTHTSLNTLRFSLSARVQSWLIVHRTPSFQADKSFRSQSSEPVLFSTLRI